MSAQFCYFARGISRPRIIGAGLVCLVCVECDLFFLLNIILEVNFYYVKGADESIIGWLHFYLGQECSLLLPGFPVTPPRNHNHPQLGSSTHADGGVKGLPWLGYIGPHGGLAGA